MWSAIPILGWALGFIVAFFMAIPFWLLWNALAPTYFYWLPQVYMNVPFWDCVWLFLLIWILKAILIPDAWSHTASKSD